MGLSRILAISAFFPPDTVGGYEWAAWEILRRLGDRGYAVRVLAGAPATPVEESFPGEVVRALRRVQIAPDTDSTAFEARTEAFQGYLHNFRVIETHIREFAPDAIYLWAGGNLTPAVVAAVESAGVPVVFHLEDRWLLGAREQTGGLGLMGAASRWIRSVLARLPRFRSDDWRLVFVSDALRRAYASDGLTGRAPVVVHNGYEPDRPPRTWPETRPETFTLGYVGRLRPNKGLGQLLDALENLQEDGRRNIRLVIAGGADPAFEQAMRTKARGMRLGDAVEWRGVLPRDEVQDLFRTFDLAVVPSTWEEPFGLVAIEAMAAGVPVLAARRGGLPEIVDDTSGWLCEPEPAILARHIGRILDDYPALRARGLSAPARVRDHFSWEDKVDSVETVFREEVDFLQS